MLGETSFVDEVLEKGRSASTGGGDNRAVYGDPDGAVRALLRQCRSAGDEPAALSVADPSPPPWCGTGATPDRGPSLGCAVASVLRSA